MKQFNYVAYLTTVEANLSCHVIVCSHFIPFS